MIPADRVYIAQVSMMKPNVFWQRRTGLVCALRKPEQHLMIILGGSNHPTHDYRINTCWLIDHEFWSILQP